MDEFYEENADERFENLFRKVVAFLTWEMIVIA